MEIECTHFFSGAAVYVNGHICMSLTPAGFALKLPTEAARRVLDNGGQQLRYFPSGPVKKGYVVLPEASVDDGPERSCLMEVCVRFSAGLLSEE